MFNSRTLFIVGAGASKEARLPIGTELADAISRLLYFEFDFGRLTRGDHCFLDSLRRHFKDIEVINAHLEAARQISGGLYLANSIDNYIDAHREDHRIAFCGKAAIAHTILRTEKSSALYVDAELKRTIDFKSLEQSWYVQFAKILFEAVPLSAVRDVFSNVSIVCFNYDRCIQQFLAHAIASLYSMPLSDARQVVEDLRIFHPYGTVGGLPGLRRPNGVEFGKAPDHLDLAQLCSGIKTYTEQVEDRQELRSEVDSAETIVFLGFAFYPQNMKLITPSTSGRTKRVFATAKGFSNDDVAVIASQIGTLFSGLRQKGRGAKSSNLEVRVRNDLTCGALFQEYRRSLAKT
jgi:hypothetical protein